MILFELRSRAASAIKVDSDSDSGGEGGGEKVKFEGKKNTSAKESKKNALYARFVNVSKITQCPRILISSP